MIKTTCIGHDKCPVFQNKGMLHTWRWRWAAQIQVAGCIFKQAETDNCTLASLANVMMSEVTP